MINRNAVIIRPRQPYIDWATQLDASDESDEAAVLPDADDEPSTYLIPEYEDEDAALVILQQCYEAIFESELEAWHTREADWPQDRSIEMFCDWFEIGFTSTIIDLCDGPIVNVDILDDEV